jgi:hypothetical protein
MDAVCARACQITAARTMINFFWHSRDALIEMNSIDHVYERMIDDDQPKTVA